MNAAIFDMALMLGAQSTHQNEGFFVLREFMKLLCDQECDRPPPY